MLLTGNIDYFLVTAFNWLQNSDGNISVHLYESKFTEFTSHRFLVHTAKKVPNMTPYHCGFPIESITPIDPLDNYLARRIQVY